MNATAPPTIIVVHRRERRSKCSVEPLREHPDFRFLTYPQDEDPIPGGYVRLGLGGPLLSPEDSARGLLVLDATWRLVSKLENRYSEIPIRSIPDYQTAYPRVSKVHDDPSAGLATIEAIYAAYHHLGRETAGLLDGYQWREEFLRLNGFEQ
jgi:pre-rRNA-processing protein TSR3